MKTDIRPTHHHALSPGPVADFAFPTRATATGDRTIRWGDGRTHQPIDVETPRVAHPFRTGTARAPDTPGRVRRFERRNGHRGSS